MNLIPAIRAKIHALLGNETPMIIQPRDFDDNLIDKAKELESERVEVAGGKWVLHLFQYRTALFVQIEDPERRLAYAYAVPAVKEAIGFKHSFKPFLEVAEFIKPQKLKQWMREQITEAGLMTVHQPTIGRDMKISELFEAEKKPGEKCFLVKSKRYNQEMKVYARDAKHARDVAAVHDHNHWFTGMAGKDVSVEEVEE
jgi:hypothetical protein